MELLLLGEDCSPQQLSEWGLINRVVSGMEALDDTVASMAAKIAAQPEFPTSSVKMQFRSIASNWSAPHKTTAQNRVALAEVSAGLRNKGDITETDGDQAIIPTLQRAAGHRSSKL